MSPAALDETQWRSRQACGHQGDAMLRSRMKGRVDKATPGEEQKRESHSGQHDLRTNSEGCTQGKEITRRP